MYQSKTQNPPSKIPREEQREPQPAALAAQQLADILQAGTPYLVTTGKRLVLARPSLAQPPRPVHPNPRRHTGY